MRREYKVQSWFWWMTIALTGLAFVVCLEPARANGAATQSPNRAATPKRAVVRVTFNAVAETVRRWPGQEQARRASASVARAGDTPALGEPTARGLRRLLASEVSPEMLVIARRIVREHHRARPGTEIVFESGGQHYVARIERHYHPEGGPVKPWGYHPGVSLLKAR